MEKLIFYGLYIIISSATEGCQMKQVCTLKTLLKQLSLCNLYKQVILLLAFTLDEVIKFSLSLIPLAIFISKFTWI